MKLYKKLKQIKQSKTYSLIDQIKQFDKSKLKHVDIADDNVSECSNTTIIYDFDFTSDSNDSLTSDDEWDNYEYKLTLANIISHTMFL